MAEIEEFVIHSKDGQGPQGTNRVRLKEHHLVGPYREPEWARAQYPLRLWPDMEEWLIEQNAALPILTAIVYRPPEAVDESLDDIVGFDAKFSDPDTAFWFKTRWF